MLAPYVRLIVRCVIFLLLMSAFIAIEFRLRSKSSDGMSLTVFAVLLVASLCCSAALSHVITESFDGVWAMFEAPGEDPEEETVGQAPKRRSAPDGNTLIDDGQEPFSDEEVWIEDAGIPLTPFQ